LRCPVDDTQLREVTRRGVKVDICSDCRGIWLDRGELEHLLDAAGDEDLRPTRFERALEHDSSPREATRPRYESRRDDDDDYKQGRRKKKSWLSEILDI
jgi:Zn-finger nucleic acid-binding protein